MGKLMGRRLGSRDICEDEGSRKGEESRGMIVIQHPVCLTSDPLLSTDSLLDCAVNSSNGYSIDVGIRFSELLPSRSETLAVTTPRCKVLHNMIV